MTLDSSQMLRLFGSLINTNNMETPKLIIKTGGGMILNVIASEDIRIAIIDYDFDSPSVTVHSPDCVAKDNQPLYSYLEEGEAREELKKLDF